MIRSSSRHGVLLVLVLGIVALLAQFAGVGGSDHRAAKKPKRPSALTLKVVPGGTVPDITSTSLAKTSVKVSKGEVVRMSGWAKVTAGAVGRAGAAQVVCGIRYSRAKDASWSLGVPYDSVVLKKRGASEQVYVDRSFEAPAADTYRMSMACHVAAPTTGAKVTAKGSMRAALGLPAGAAQPIG
jgi:hypothetical protein